MAPSRSLIAQPQAAVLPRAAFLLATVLLLFATPADAEEVYVLPAGGISALPLYQVETGPPARIEPLGSQPLRLPAHALASYTDLVVLPGGALLLGDGSGRGAVFFGPDGGFLRSLFNENEMIPPPSVVAAAYAGPNHPDLLLMGDASTGRILLYDLVNRLYAWSANLSRDGLRGQPRRAILLPGDRVAVALSWPALSLSALKIFPLENNPSPLQSLYSHQVASEQEAPLPVLDGLHPLRDLSADLDGRLLITSAGTITLFTEALDPIWSFSIGDDPDLIGGEFQSARFLDSGLILAATREPGQWTTPHTHHRLFLFDPLQERPLLGRSAALDRAPLRLEVRQGQGGTGTRDYYADAFQIDEPGLDALLLEEPLQIDPEEIPRNRSGHFQFRLSNQAEQSLTLRRIELRAQSGSCEDLPLPEALTLPLWSRTNRVLFSQEPFQENGIFPTAELAIGPHCAQLAITDRQGVRSYLGDPVSFSVLPPSGQEDGPVRVDDLPRDDQGDPEAEFSDLDGDLDGGCVCTASDSGPPASMLLVVAALLFVALRPRRDALDNS